MRINQSLSEKSKYIVGESARYIFTCVGNFVDELSVRDLETRLEDESL